MTFPDSLQQQLREGRAAAAEVPAPDGRRGFVIIRPEGGAQTLEESLRQAAAQGQIPTAQSFTVTHDEYDAAMIEGYDYDVGWVRHRVATVPSVEDCQAIIREWGMADALLRPYVETGAP